MCKGRTSVMVVGRHLEGANKSLQLSSVMAQPETEPSQQGPVRVTEQGTEADGLKYVSDGREGHISNNMRTNLEGKKEACIGAETACLREEAKIMERSSIRASIRAAKPDVQFGSSPWRTAGRKPYVSICVMEKTTPSFVRLIELKGDDEDVGPYVACTTSGITTVIGLFEASAGSLLSEGDVTHFLTLTRQAHTHYKHIHTTNPHAP